jgi:hypothetical protein
MKKTFKRGTQHSQRGTVSIRRDPKKLPPGIRAPIKTGDTTGRNEKPSPIQPLESALAARRQSQTEWSGLTKLLADKSARLAALEKTGDLHDAAVIADLSRLQIFTSLLPRRIAAQEEADAQAEQTLIQAVNQFIHQHLGPRVRRLATRTRGLVEGELSPHFPERSALIVAVSQSERVRHIESLALPATLHPPRGAMTHAESALNAWKAADQFEHTLPPESAPDH